MKAFPRSGALLLLAIAAVPCSARPATGALTQRGVNAFAAELSRARRAVIEGTGLRRPGEPLRDYLSRILRPLPGESAAARALRVGSYVAALDTAARRTAAIRTLPPLADRSAANLRVWQEAVRCVAALPADVGRLHATLRQNPQSGPAADRELYQCVHLVVTALDDLRDALP